MWGIRRLRPLLTLVLAAGALAAVPAVVVPASAAVQPCTVTYQAPGTPIRSQFDTGKNHSLHWYNFDVQDPRQVVDVDIAIDWAHPDAASLALHLLSPQTTSALVPTIQAVNTKMASGSVNGSYTFDEELTSAPIAGTNPPPGNYRPATPEDVLEGHPGQGTWSLWLSNYGNQPGTVRWASITLTYATCDTDGDGTEDKVDNCTSVANADQSNRDDDALGDACDLDVDGDRVGNATDGCPATAAATASGCPAVGRTASLRYAKTSKKLTAVVRSDASGCRPGAELTLFRSKPGKDVKLVVSTTNAKGRWVRKAPKAAGRYYVKVAASYAAGQAECGTARSRKAQVPNVRTSMRALMADTDGDGLDDLVDGCPTVASSNSTGCPSAGRSVSLRWLAGTQRLQVRVSSPVAGCAQRARIALFRVRPNRDFKVFGGSVSFSGRLRIKVARGSTYYVTVPQSYASGIAECGAAESRKVIAAGG